MAPATGTYYAAVYGYGTGTSAYTIRVEKPTQLDITTPGGGEDWKAGTTYTIYWNSSNVTGGIQIQPYLNGEGKTNIAAAAPNTGSYIWSIPLDYLPGTTYQIRLSAMGGTVSDFSPEFTISSPTGTNANYYVNDFSVTNDVYTSAIGNASNDGLRPQVSEAISFSSALVTPEETATLLKKSSLFTPSPTAIKHEVKRLGDLIEAHREELNKALHAQETAPEGTQALVASLDGATVLLNEKGQRFGRPAVRPRGDEPKETPTAYRISMVGSVSYYGPSAQSQSTPPRLESRYVSHMPETRCPAFKAQFEAELDAAQAHAPPGTPRILLLDGARELWNYLDKHPRFDDYHRCIDFFHVVEHLSVAAEALFANSSDKAKKWYEKYYAMLKQSDDAASKICRSIDYYEKRQSRAKHNKSTFENNIPISDAMGNACRTPLSATTVGPLEAVL